MGRRENEGRHELVALNQSGHNMAVTIWVTVKPLAKRDDVKKTADGEYVASVRAPVNAHHHAIGGSFRFYERQTCRCGALTE